MVPEVFFSSAHSVSICRAMCLSVRSEYSCWWHSCRTLEDGERDGEDFSPSDREMRCLESRGRRHDMELSSPDLFEGLVDFLMQNTPDALNDLHLL